jgi:SAM-dependent methyltransferase
MKEMWEERYAEEVYAYGTEPNEFFKKSLETLGPGRILLPADGEGRNGVYAARKGWDVLSLDFSHNARKKATELARLHNVSIHYLISDIFLYPYPENRFDAIGLIYVHMPPEKRRQLHAHVTHALKPGGTLILEGFGKDQIKYGSGGPRNIDMLFSTSELRQDFGELKIDFLEEKEVFKKEGLFHEGKASIIQMTAQKIGNN